MTATFPLQSCRMFASCRSRNFGRWNQTVDRDRSRLRTAIETNAASGAVVTAIACRMHSVGTQFRSKLQAFWRAGLDAQPASFALFDINRDIAARLASHAFLSPRNRRLGHLRMLQPLGLFAISVQPLAEVRMRDLDQRLGPLANRLAVQVCHAVFR